MREENIEIIDRNPAVSQGIGMCASPGRGLQGAIRIRLLGGLCVRKDESTMRWNLRKVYSNLEQQNVMRTRLAGIPVEGQIIMIRDRLSLRK